jgi:D-alanyl-D-alanine carboxypeptidase (penicillin-binding protein 5/6)
MSLRRGLHLMPLFLTLCITPAGARPAGAQPASPAPKPPTIQASSAILVDAVSGQVLYEKNADLPRPPASTTKIMTAILLLENTRPDDVITASKRASETGGSSLNLQPGEKITARDLLYALMLRSANDGCVAAAERIAGSEAKFAAMMTQKAREIGATHTIFRNCNGLNEPPNSTTARDLALMARYAAAHFPEFNRVTDTKFYWIKRNINKEDNLLKNHAKFLWKFPGADGIKTGYTFPAGHCFVGAATWNGWRLISVVMRSPDYVTETARLMKYGFLAFEARRAAERGRVYASVPVREGRENAVPAAAQNAIQYVVPKGQPPEIVEIRPRFEPITAPVRPGEQIGTLEAWKDAKIIGSAPLVAVTGVERTAAATARDDGDGWYLFCALLGTVVIGYGTAAAKTARRRRHRLQALMRDLDCDR